MGTQSRTWAAIAGVLLATPGFTQNEVFHYDGTTEATSRGTGPTAAKVLAQRLPSDQICAATSIAEFSTIMQDQNFTTTVTAEAQIRASLPAGGPDLSAAGLIGSSGPLVISFPMPGTGVASAALVSFSFTPPLAVAVGNSTPAGDLYAAVAVNPEPTWPLDGGSIHVSGSFSGAAGEQFSATTVSPYSMVAGAMNLGWDGPVGGMAVVSSANRAWRIAPRLGNAVTQPFAFNPAAFTGAPGTGLSPNFGYAGIFPDMLRLDPAMTPIPDGIGFRLRATAPPGLVAVLVLSTTRLATPIPLPPLGSICIDPSFTFPLFALTGPPAPPIPGSSQKPQPPGTSEALFGPFPGSPAFAGAGPIHVQAALVDQTTTPPTILLISTMSTLYL